MNRAGTVIPSQSRASLPSDDTSAIVPKPAPMRSSTTSGSPLMHPLASIRLAIRNRADSNVSCLRVDVSVPSMRARNMRPRQMMRSAPPMANCRSRVKVIGVVMPSPVGVAMVWLK